MSKLATWIVSALVALAAQPGHATDDAAQLFATCAGRLSAEMEHQWLMRDPAADQTEAQRTAMLALLDAVTPAGDARHILAWRIDAKQAQAVLLTRATFNDDAKDATWARRRAEAEIAACTGLLLS